MSGLVVMLTAVFLCTGCGGTSEEAETPLAQSDEEFIPAERLTFSGSTTVQPLAEKLAEVYRRKTPGAVLEIGAGGSRVGIQAVQEGSADIGMISRNPREGELSSGVEQHQIAIDVLAMIVNSANPVNGLTLEQLRGIYTGDITNWQEVGGNNIPIRPIIREISSGTRGAFDEIALEGETLTENAVAKVTAGEVHTSVAENEDAIGYVGFGHLSGSEVKVLSIDGVAPSPESAKDESYTLKRPLMLLVGPLSRPEAHSFVSFALSKEGQDIVREDGWVPVLSETSPNLTR